MTESRSTASHSLTRRDALKGAAGVMSAAMLARTRAVSAADSNAPSNRVRVAVIGVSRTPKGGEGRGTHLAHTLTTLSGVEVAYVCDVDSVHLGKAVDSVGKKQGTPPKGVKDFRNILDDKSIDAVVIATPDHWHAPAAILACAAGKQVYVEKPCCQNPREGELLLAAARKHDRLVQQGTQRRSWPGVIEAIAKLREGAIGRVIEAKTWYFNNRPTIGHGEQVDAPSTLDWDLWQGPAPRRPFRDNYVHYNWHWFWQWGTGELGNNGVHFLDVARWGLGVDHPIRVTSGGGKYRYDDDQETPDTQNISLDFDGRKTITWENRSWAAQTPLDPAYDVAFYGEHGSLLVKGGGYTICDLKGKEVSKSSQKSDDAAIHLQNFVTAVRGEGKLSAEIAVGVSSVMLCHLGNIAYRTGHALHLDPNGNILNDPDAANLWGREYQEGWEPKV
jgi:predicted dehydrogenase